MRFGKELGESCYTWVGSKGKRSLQTAFGHKCTSQRRAKLDALHLCQPKRTVERVVLWQDVIFPFCPSEGCAILPRVTDQPWIRRATRLWVGWLCVKGFLLPGGLPTRSSSC